MRQGTRRPQWAGTRSMSVTVTVTVTAAGVGT